MRGMAGVGSKFAPAVGAVKTAAPALGGAIQGVGIGVGAAAGQAAMAPAKGILGWFAGFKPENLYSGMVVFAVLLYFLDFMTGFDITRTAALRVWGFGMGGAAILAITGGYISFWRVVIAAVFFYSVYGLLNALTGTFVLGIDLGILTSLLTDERALIALVLGTGALYTNLQIPGAIKLLPVFMLLETYGLPVLRDKMLTYVATSSGYLWFMVGFLSNRILFPLPLMYSIFAFYRDSRTARNILGLLIIIYLIASLPQIKGAYTKYAGLTGVETEQAQGVFTRLQANIRGIVSGEIFRAPSASLYEKAEIAFGFGKPKEEPKMGLQLRDDPNMPKVFDLNFYDAASPSIIMEVPNPLPLTDPRKRVMSVVDIECNDKATGGSGGEVAEPLPDPKPNEPATYALVYYKGPKQVTCRFKKMKEGSNTAEIKVKYGFVADAEFSTPFMRRDRLEAKIFKGEDPVVEDNVPSSTAEYDNGPIAITWGSVELVSPPVDIKAGSPLGFLLFVSKTGSWEGEIAGINSLTLTIPSEFELVEKNDKTCAFQKVKEKSNADVNVYKVKDDMIKKDGTLSFIGDGVRLMCGMSATDSLINELAGPDEDDRRRPWKAGTFKASVDYIFSTEKTVSFEIKGCKSGDAKDCIAKDTNCPGKQTCNADGVWGEVCNDIPNDGCPKGGEGT